MSEEKIFHKKNELCKQLAKAKADRVYLMEFRKSKKAILMKEAHSRQASLSAAAQERDAYAHDDYQTLLDGLRVAVEDEELLRHQVDIIDQKFDEWRAIEATKRAEISMR